MKQLKGSLMLLLATFFWGTTFVAQSAAAESLSAFTFNASRSFVGAAFLGIIILIQTYIKKDKNTIIEDKKSQKEKKHSVWIAGGLCGIVLFAAMNFQQAGITVYPEQVASSGRSGFLTATYVIMVAVSSRFFGKKLHKLVYLAVLLCIFGMYLLCISDGFSSLYFGDVLEILCAVCFTAHIMVVDHFSNHDSIKLCCVQFLTGGLLSMIMMFIFDKPDFSMIWKAIGPILYAGILSSGIAYTLQIEGQKYSEPAVASVIMSFESVFAVLGGWLVLGERLSVRETIGCLLVFAAIIIAQIPQMIHTREK